jgi:hypothetical protein
VFNIGEKRMKTQKKSPNVAARIAVIFTAAMLAFTGCQQALNSGYEGDVAVTPVSIGNANDLMVFAASINAGTAPVQDAILTADIDLSGLAFIPIGNPGTPYKGFFNGNGMQINNLSVSLTTGFAGLFGVNRGTIQNLTVSGTVQRAVSREQRTEVLV